MKAKIKEIEVNSGYLGQSSKVTMVGYSEIGNLITLTVEDDGCLKESLATKLGPFTDIELEIKITGKMTKIERITI